jgi:V/A-type H+-transporting ATPase subunit E
MSIESLVAKIIEDTRKAASQIQQRSLTEVRTSEGMTEKAIEQIMESARDRAARSAEEQRQRMLSMAELENRKELLTTKQSLIEEAFGRAIERILSLDTEAYGAFLIDLILQAEPQGDEEILFNQKDRKRFEDGWVEGVNQRLVASGKKGSLNIARETRPIRGGVFLRRGRKEVNCSIESVILSKRNQLESAVAEILFGNGR